MRSVGVRELRENTARILKAVKDQGEIVEVTHHGRVMARLVPPPEQDRAEELKRAISRAHELMNTIGQEFTEPIDTERG